MGSASANASLTTRHSALPDRSAAEKRRNRRLMKLKGYVQATETLHTLARDRSPGPLLSLPLCAFPCLFTATRPRPTAFVRRGLPRARRHTHLASSYWPRTA